MSARTAIDRGAARHVAAALALACALCAGAGAAGAEVVDYAPLDTVLARHLRDGRVDYGGLARDPGPLRRFLAAAERARPEGHDRAEQIAFWVNVYNARVLDGVIRRPELESVLDVGKILGIPTVAFFRERRLTAGRERSLNDIEHGILRRRYDDPRVHFVVNCASASCPVLPARPMRSATLDAQMDAARAAFLGDPSRNRIAADGTLELSAIFKWYGEDFTDAGGVAAYAARHWPGPAAPAPTARVRFLPYDWSLNGSW